MATEPALTFSLASVVQEVLQQHASRLDANSASRKTEETCIYNPFPPFFSYKFQFFTFTILLSKSIQFCFLVCMGHSLTANIIFLGKKRYCFRVSANK